jgi:hypothetical protein
MPTKTFEGKDPVDLNKQIWDWKSANPKIKELKRHAVETLPLTMNKMVKGATLTAPNHVSIRIDYLLEK